MQLKDALGQYICDSVPLVLIYCNTFHVDTNGKLAADYVCVKYEPCEKHLCCASSEMSLLIHKEMQKKLRTLAQGGRLVKLGTLALLFLVSLGR